MANQELLYKISSGAIIPQKHEREVPHEGYLQITLPDKAQITVDYGRFVITNPELNQSVSIPPSEVTIEEGYPPLETGGVAVLMSHLLLNHPDWYIDEKALDAIADNQATKEILSSRLIEMSLQ